ncbi:unnamed protein product [Paramecium pentaurelia]|uniref:Uncharacterized protein n=1 Tax=Paramecium pentaurelia TaxID=43138 RepID=A0A8S1VVB2_9CILI|nr:unnamed protein product [Paramecium pentaurelia]CAD8180193.1 unnamed protein product [Paramecium pentaurelia]
MNRKVYKQDESCVRTKIIKIAWNMEEDNYSKKESEFVELINRNSLICTQQKSQLMWKKMEKNLRTQEQNQLILETRRRLKAIITYLRIWKIVVKDSMDYLKQKQQIVSKSIHQCT